MRYIIMCGGQYDKWEQPKHITKINGEPNVARTIRMLRNCGIEDIAISSNHSIFEQFGVPVLKHNNNYRLGLEKDYGHWVDGFYLMYDPCCYLFGDVVFSLDAIKTIIDTPTDSIEFFASAPPFSEEYSKAWAEPFAFKVVDHAAFSYAIELVKMFDLHKAFRRKPVAWELWQVIKQTPLNLIDYTNYTVINDYTCDIDNPEDLIVMERYIR